MGASLALEGLQLQAPPNSSQVLRLISVLPDYVPASQVHRSGAPCSVRSPSHPSPPLTQTVVRFLDCEPGYEREATSAVSSNGTLLDVCSICPSDTYSPDGVVCKECGEGTVCLGPGAILPITRRGFWAASLGDVARYQCPEADACLGYEATGADQCTNLTQVRQALSRWPSWPSALPPLSSAAAVPWRVCSRLRGAQVRQVRRGLLQRRRRLHELQRARLLRLLLANRLLFHPDHRGVDSDSHRGTTEGPLRGWGACVALPSHLAFSTPQYRRASLADLLDVYGKQMEKRGDFTDLYDSISEASGRSYRPAVRCGGGPL